MSKRSPKDILDDIERSEVDDAIEQVASMSPEQRRKELVEAGFTEAELDAKADTWHARLERAAIDEGKKRLEAEARAKSLRPPPQSNRPVVLIAAAVAAAAVVLGLLFFPGSTPREAPPVAVPSSTAPPSAAAGSSAPTPSVPPLPSALPMDAALPEKTKLK